MERQAYEEGNLCFRDWEDSVKGTIYNESLQKGAKNKMSFKQWKDKEISTILTEKWGFSFNLLAESQDEEAAEEEVVEEAAEDLDERRGRGRDREGMEPDSRRRAMSEGEDQEELEEADKPDFLDIDKDGDKEESMKDAAEDKKESVTEAKVRQLIRKLVKEAAARGR